MIYNVKFATDPILIVAGDDIDFWLLVQEYDSTTDTWSDLDMDALDLEFKIWNKHGTEIVSLSTSAGTLISNVGLLNFKAAPIDVIACCASLDGHLYIVAPKSTLWKGIVKFM